MAASRYRKKKKESKLGIMGICLVVIIFGAVMHLRTKDAKEQMEVLSRRQEQLEEQLADEQDRAKRLEERRVYVKTKMYIEEMAKELGLVYPDEIIYKPEK